jgi:succinoglycan biosynthesis protein ExoM
MIDHISVCICTFRRNATLARLLRNLTLQETGGQFSFSVVVVDNDTSGSAEAEVIRSRTEWGLEIAYGIEQERTIPAARNHALRLAKGGFIAIIDDDELPPPHWLRTLYEAVRTLDVDGALGPVFPFFEGIPPVWLVKSRLCELPSWRSGTLLQWNQTRTGNVLLKKEVFDRNGLHFDERFRTGGSDQAFFREAMNAGFRFVGIAEAPVYEIVPPARWSKRYWVRRALVNGYNAQKYLERDGLGLKTMTALFKSTGALVVYAVSAPLCACLGTHVLMNCVERGSYHLSRVAATFGIELWKRRDF